jgi:molybdate transport system substrate-binding protein
VKSFFASALVAAALSPVPAVRADEITLIAPGGIRDAIQKMIPGFERKTGHTVKATFGSGGGTKRQVLRGEAFDVPIVQPPLAEVLASGHVIAASETPLATVPVAVAVRKGAARPDIATPEAAKALLSYLSSPEVAGVYKALGMSPGR